MNLHLHYKTVYQSASGLDWLGQEQLAQRLRDYAMPIFRDMKNCVSFEVTEEEAILIDEGIKRDQKHSSTMSDWMER